MRSVLTGLLLVGLTATPAFADGSTTVEIDPNAPLRPGESVVMKSPALAALLAAGLPLIATAPVFVLKPGALSSGLVFGAPALAAAGDLYGGNPWRALSVAIGGPVVTLGGWGAGLLYAKAAGISDTAASATSGMWWGYGLYLAWAAADAYVTADLANKKALTRAGINE